MEHRIAGDFAVEADFLHRQLHGGQSIVLSTGQTVLSFHTSLGIRTGVFRLTPGVRFHRWGGDRLSYTARNEPPALLLCSF